MFRLPICPHCKTVYRYKDVKKAQKEKECVCYHCQRIFRARLFPGVLIIGGIILALCIMTNIFLLSRMTYLNLLLLFAATLLYLGLLYILLPFFVSFRKTEDQREKSSVITNKKHK